MAVTTITTAAELDALPVGSVVRTAVGTTFVREDGSWREPGWTWHPSSRDIFLPATLLTPDVPVATSVLGSIMNPPPPWKPFGFHAPLSPVPDLEFWGEDGSGDPLWERPMATGADVPPAPTETLTSVSTVKPDRDDLMRLVQNEVGGFLAHDPERPEAFYGYIADAILAAWPGRTGADVLNDAADALEGRLGTEGAPKTLWEFRQWLRTRARGEGRR